MPRVHKSWTAIFSLESPEVQGRAKTSQQQSTASIVAACKRCVVAQGRKPTAPHPPARWAASAQFTNTTCHIEPPKDPFNRRLHQLRLDRIYSSWLTNYSPPKRLRPSDRGLAPTALKMPPLPGLRTDEAALIGVRIRCRSPQCSRELSPKSYGCLAPVAENFHRRAYGCLAPVGATS